MQTGIIGALSPFDSPGANTVVLDLVTGPAASGSPVFRQETGEVFGVLTAGQLKGRAAFSLARIIHHHEHGIVVKFTGRVEAQERTLDMPRNPKTDGT